jgi:ATP-GRASP peptide maturase of grasp-with-spasm system
MILILSDEYDTTTTLVIDWLESINKKWIRINSNDIVKIKLLGNDINFIIKEVEFKLSELTGYWYRRGFLNIYSESIKLNDPFKDFRKVELNKLIEYIYFSLSKLKSINRIENSDLNKLIVTDIARELHILTPIDLLFSEKKSLNFFLKPDLKYISKSISGESLFEIENFTLFNYSSIVQLDKIGSKTFFPSLVQNYIEKKYELRIFYLKKKMYSMVIFSQNDKKTNIDFRNYNKEKPNRTVPFKLPIKVEKSLIKLMDLIKLDCGSIDMIVTPDDKYVFLEVNPIGQFGMVSFPCNYNLEKLIASYL